MFVSQVVMLRLFPSFSLPEGLPPTLTVQLLVDDSPTIQIPNCQIVHHNAGRGGYIYNIKGINTKFKDFVDSHMIRGVRWAKAGSEEGNRTLQVSGGCRAPRRDRVVMRLLHLRVAASSSSNR